MSVVGSINAKGVECWRRTSEHWQLWYWEGDVKKENRNDPSTGEALEDPSDPKTLGMH